MFKLLGKKRITVLDSGDDVVLIAGKLQLVSKCNTLASFVTNCTLLAVLIHMGTVKPVLSSHPKRRPKLVFKTDYRLMQVKSIAECSKVSILQFFRPSLSYHLSLRSLFCLFLSDHLRQVLL